MSTEQVQIQTGNHSKSAARDYVEIHQYLNEKCWLLQASIEEKDRLALNDEVYFKRRFGFNAPLEQRRDVIKIKNKFDFTDKEIRLLKFSGLLTARKGKRTSIHACRCVYISGILYLILSFVLILAPAIFSIFDSPGLYSIHIRLAGLVMVFFSILLFTNAVSLEPINILKRRKLNIGDTFII